MDRVGIDHVHALGDQRLAREQDCLRLEGGIERVGLERRRNGADHRLDIRLFPAGTGDESAHHQLLDRLVACERVAVRLRQPLELARLALGPDDDRGREIAVDRQQRRLGHMVERDALPLLVEEDEALGADFVAAGLADQRSLERNRHRLLGRLAGRRIDVLLEMQGRRLRIGVVLHPRGDLRGSRLTVPDLERRQVRAAGVLERLHEIVAGRRLAVVALEIEVGAGAELVAAEHGREHADQLGALVVHGCGVEVRNLDIAVRPDRVGEGPGVFRELRGAEHAHVLDSLDRGAAGVG